MSLEAAVGFRKKKWEIEEIKNFDEEEASRPDEILNCAKKMENN